MFLMVPIPDIEMIDFLEWLKRNKPWVHVKALSNDQYNELIGEYFANKDVDTEFKMNQWRYWREKVERAAGS